MSPTASEDPHSERDSWDPSADRFGIAISGGGIRSASFALGALGELRRRGLLRQARYVTAVSGGSYAASALEHANRKGEPVDTTERRLRRRLGYLLPDTRTSLAGLARILLGLFVNLWILYLVIFMVARPIGWTIGSPLVQQGLRYDGPVAVGVVDDPDDPDTKSTDFETWNDPEKCALEASPEARPTVTAERATASRFGDATVALIEFELDAPTQCLVVEHEHSESQLWTIDLVTDDPGLIRIENGVAEIIRQPTLEPSNPLPIDCQLCQIEWRQVADIVDIEVDDLELSEEAEAAIDVESVTELLEPIEPVVVDPDSIVELRGDLDIDVRHWLIPVVTGLAMLVAWIYAGTNRAMRSVESRRRATFRGRVAAWMFAASLTLFFILPLLVKTLPETITGALETGPTEEQLSSVSWLPAGVNPLLAWPVLAVTTVITWVQERRAASKKQTSGKEGAKGARSAKRNSAALLSKAITFLTRLAVALILILLVVTTSIMQMTTAAINGPFGDYTWISREFFGRRIPWPPDLVTWAAVIIVLLLIRSTFAAGSWSLGPYYRRQLRWAFMGDSIGHDAFDGSDEDDDESDGESDCEDGNRCRERAGYLDDTAAELVICAAANVTGVDRAPTGRHAVSFSASRSWIGGPEIGWMPTKRYLANLGDARKQDVTVSAMTAVSGAAASPAMGKQSVGPIGAILAVLNVRLGAWLPHPMAVDNIPDPARPGLQVWKHRPGWPYFVREVLRRHRHESAYLYVSDGGHWENLGLVEALRRGCNTIVVISAAGDGASSHGTFAEAVEIARTDLDIEIRFDDIWKMRPPVGGDTELELPSGRQFLRQSGDNPEVGRAAPRGWTFGTFKRNGVSAPNDEGQILLLEASMVDELTVDVHAYAESHHEFPDINTGDQFFTHRDFESYRKLGEDLVDRSLRTYTGYKFEQRILALPAP